MEIVSIDLSEIAGMEMQNSDGTYTQLAAWLRERQVKEQNKMNDKERYLVCTTDGKSHTVVARTFGEVEKMFGEANIWQMIKLDFEEVKE